VERRRGKERGNVIGTKIPFSSLEGGGGKGEGGRKVVLLQLRKQERGKMEDTYKGIFPTFYQARLPLASPRGKEAEKREGKKITRQRWNLNA